MKTRNLLLALLLFLVLFGALSYYYYLGRQRRFEWKDSWSKKAYTEQSDEPYGLRSLHRLLQNYTPGQQCTDLKKNVGFELKFDSTVAQSSSYVFVGEALYLDSLSTERLLAFVGAGNTALIASKTIPYDLMFHLYFEECNELAWDDYEQFEDSIVTLSLRQPPLPTPPDSIPCFFAVQNQPKPYTWHRIPLRYFCNALPQMPLGYLNGEEVNFAEFPFGKGRFLLHSTPLAFTNFSLLRPNMRRYAEGVLSQLPQGRVYWDAVSRVPEAVARRRNQGGGGYARQLEEEHPLSYMLQQPALAWAWYLLVGLTGIWLLFRTRRRQRIIPVLPPNENSSYEFISTIANLHFRERNYRGLCQQGMRLFLARVRERYGLVAVLDATQSRLKQEVDFVQRLATMSELPADQVRAILDNYAAAIQFQTTEDAMIDLHRSMDVFWRQAK
jgi:hypothetical protein